MNAYQATSTDHADGAFKSGKPLGFMDGTMEALFLDHPGSIAEGDELMYYNGPLLFFMTLGQQGNRVLCVTLEDTAQAWPHLVVEVTPEQEHRLLSNRVTLRKLCLECVVPQGLGAYFLMDSNSDVWELHPLAAIPEDYLPGDVYLSPPSKSSP